MATVIVVLEDRNNTPRNKSINKRIISTDRRPDLTS